MANESKRAVVPTLLAGMLLGAGVVALAAISVVGLTLLCGVPLMVIMSAGFGDARPLLLMAAVIVALLLVGLAIFGLARAWMLAMRPRGLAGSVSMAAGGLLAAAMSVWAMPVSVKDAALAMVSGQSDGDRAGSAAQGRLQAYASAPGREPEADLLRAVDTVAEPDVPGARQLTRGDTQARVDALRRLESRLPAEWQPVLLATLAQTQRIHSGDHPDDQAMRDTLARAGRAGGLGFAVSAAELDEGIAARHEKSGKLEAADASWRRALAGYAFAGAGFELARLRDTILPERLRELPAPLGASGAAKTDAAFALRLGGFALALGADRDHARPGQRDLAAALTLLATERTPNVAQIAALYPSPGSGADVFALGRWQLALRHARGDCAAATTLSNATRQRRRPPRADGERPAASSLDMAWAMAWAEAGDTCARTDAERELARACHANLDYLIFDPAELDAARAGVAATIAALR